jgi:hypothetical protein
MAAFRTVKLFDLEEAPGEIRDAIRPVARGHVSSIDESAIWEVTVGTYDWQGAAEEWALHRWMKEHGAADGETVLVKLDDVAQPGGRRV